MAGCTVHLYHPLTLDPGISLLSFCYYQLLFLFFISLCPVPWILIPKETVLLQVLPPQQHTRSYNYTLPPAQGVLYSPSAPFLGWPHNLTFSSDSDGLSNFLEKFLNRGEDSSFQRIPALQDAQRTSPSPVHPHECKKLLVWLAAEVYCQEDWCN